MSFQKDNSKSLTLLDNNLKKKMSSVTYSVTKLKETRKLFLFMIINKDFSF